MPPAVAGEQPEENQEENEYEWLGRQLQHITNLHLGVAEEGAAEEEWADPTGGVLTGILAACEFGEVDRLKELLEEADFDINTPGPDGDSALHIASLYGHYECVTALLNKGANAGIVNPEDGSSPIHDAAAGGFKDILELLIERSPSSLDTPDNDGDTPLHNAARGNHLHIVEVLVKHCANVNALNRDGNTPAQEADDPQVAEFLETLP